MCIFLWNHSEVCVSVGQPVKQVVYASHKRRVHVLVQRSPLSKMSWSNFASVPQTTSLRFLSGYSLVVGVPSIETKGSVHGGSVHKTDFEQRPPQRVFPGRHSAEAKTPSVLATSPQSHVRYVPSVFCGAREVLETVQPKVRSPRNSLCILLCIQSLHWERQERCIPVR